MLQLLDRIATCYTSVHVHFGAFVIVWVVIGIGCCIEVGVGLAMVQWE